jgi:hypothetical protein
MPLPSWWSIRWLPLLEKVLSRLRLDAVSDAGDWDIRGLCFLRERARAEMGEGGPEGGSRSRACSRSLKCKHSFLTARPLCTHIRMYRRPFFQPARQAPTSSPVYTTVVTCQFCI